MLSVGMNQVFPDCLAVIDLGVIGEDIFTHSYAQVYPVIIELRAKDPASEI